MLILKKKIAKRVTCWSARRAASLSISLTRLASRAASLFAASASACNRAFSVIPSSSVNNWSSGGRQIHHKIQKYEGILSCLCIQLDFSGSNKPSFCRLSKSSRSFLTFSGSAFSFWSTIKSHNQYSKVNKLITSQQGYKTVTHHLPWDN